jgi:hypothetical protein
MVRLLLVAVAVATATVFGPATPAWAETCEAHLAKQGTTKEADIAYHSVHGGESPCKGDSNKSNNSGKSDSNPDRDWHRSKWEDRTSFDCGWSWRGGFGC